MASGLWGVQRGWEEARWLRGSLLQPGVGAGEEAWDGQSASSLQDRAVFPPHNASLVRGYNAPVSDLIGILLLTTALKVKL